MRVDNLISIRPQGGYLQIVDSRKKKTEKLTQCYNTKGFSIKKSLLYYLVYLKWLSFAVKEKITC